MPLADPTIALQVQGAQPSSAAANPLALITGIAQARKSMAEAQMEQSSLAAHQVAGQIFATSPDAPTAIKALMANPLTSAFAPELAQDWAGTQNALLAAQSTQQGMAVNAFGLMTKALVSGVHDPKMLGSSLDSIMATVPATVRPQVEQAKNALVKGLMQGLPTDADGNLTPEAGAEYQKRLSDTYTSFSGSADAVRGSTGAVAPSIGFQPGVGPGNRGAFVYTGGEPTGAPTAAIVGSQPGNQAPLQGLSPQEQAEQGTTGQVIGGLKKEMSDAGSTIPVEAKRLNLLQDALQGFAAGGGMEARGQIAQSMQALQKMGFDIPQDAIDKVAGGSLSGLQYFNQQIKQAAIAQLRTAQQGMGKASAMELNNAIESLAVDNDPAMLMEDLNKAKYALQVQYDRIDKFNQMEGLSPAELKKKYGISDLSQFNNWYLENANDKNLPSATGSGIELGPRPFSTAKGTKADSGSSGPVKIGTKAEYDRLAPGTQYIAPDGSTRVKK